MGAGAHKGSAQTTGTQTQTELQSRIAAHRPAAHLYVKKNPLVGWLLTSNRFEDIPQAIREHLGDVDKTDYSQAYLAENEGTIIALQMDGGKPDFYIIQKATFESDYTEVEAAAALKQNPALATWVETQPELAVTLQADKGAVVGARKSVQVEMLNMSALGYGLDAAVTIQSPWGEQSKPAGEEAYLSLDKASGQYYLINQDDQGHPLSYMPVP